MVCLFSIILSDVIFFDLLMILIDSFLKVLGLFDWFGIIVISGLQHIKIVDD